MKQIFQIDMQQLTPALPPKPPYTVYRLNYGRTNPEAGKELPASNFLLLRKLYFYGGSILSPILAALHWKNSDFRLRRQKPTMSDGGRVPVFYPAEERRRADFRRRLHLKAFRFPTSHPSSSLGRASFRLPPSAFRLPPSDFPLPFLLLALAMLLSCQQPRERVTTPAFYHWQTRLELSPQEQSLVKELGVQRLYVKFFDVDWDPELQAPVPLAQVELAPESYSGLELAPTVFLTNRTLERLSGAEVPGLAGKIHDKIFSLAAQDSSLHIREVQMDCDWTATTREAYFELLGRLRGMLRERGVSLSATIRLHQARFPARTGVPPADRGILMFYNIGQLQQWEEPNSILNLEAAKPYLKGYEPYPLPLGLALPLFRWGVLFRDGEMIKLINNLTEERLAESPKFQALGPARYEVLEGTFLEGHYLYPGDRIRLEAVAPEQLFAAAERLRELPWPDTLEVVFYHLDGVAVSQYAPEVLDSLYKQLARE